MLETEPGHEGELELPEFAFEDPIMMRLTRLPHEAVLDWWHHNALAERWRGYQAELLVRTSLADNMTFWQQFRLGVELVGYVAALGIFWTAVVFTGLALVGVILAGLGF